ncbi:MAG: hypothetical protein ACREFW_09270 [Rhizomicrobium sp.]
MKSLLFGIAAAGFLSLMGCTSYPGAIQTGMAQAVPPYHPMQSADLDAQDGIKPVESATHDFDIRIAPFL